MGLSTSLKSFLGSVSGAIGKAAETFFSGEAKVQVEDVKAASETTKTTISELRQNIIIFVQKFWWFMLLIIGLIWIMRKKNPYDFLNSRKSSPRKSSPRKSSPRKSSSRKSNSRRSSGSSKGRWKPRKIHGVLYTSKKAWSDKMHSLRKRKK